MTSRIVFVSFGTLGDLFPILRVASELGRRGHQVEFLTNEEHVDRVTAAGVYAHGLTYDEAGNTNTSAFDWSMRVGTQARSAMLDLARGADLIVGNNFLQLAPLAARALDIPHMKVAFQPATPVLAHDPTLDLQMPVFIYSPRSRLALAWNRAMLRIVRAVFWRIYGKQYDALARAYGCPGYSYTPVIEQEPTSPPALALYSPLLVLPDPDPTPKVEIVGTPFDPDMPQETLDPEITAFLDAGPAPLVFTLGSNDKIDVADHYQTARKIAEALGLRAVMVRGKGHVDATPDCMVCGHVPHSALFPHAAAIIHQGGPLTLAEAFVAAKPQLIVPQVDDQLDIAMRAHRLGTAGVIARPERFSVAAAVPVLRRLLNDPEVAARATELAGIIGKERGASVAADRIEAYLAKCAARSV